MKYELRNLDGIFEIKTYGDADLEGFISLWKQLIAHEKWQPHSRILLDHSGLHCGPLTVSEIETIAEKVGSMNRKLGGAKLAVFVARDLEYGMVRMRQVYIEGKWDVTERVFRSPDEAIIWLNEV